MKKLLIFLILFLNKESIASTKFITGAGINKVNIVDENLAVPSNINYSFSYGLINAKKGLSYSLTTNRGLEQVNKSTVRINSTDRYATLKTRITSDVLTLGYNYKRSIYSVNILNVKKISKLNESKREKNAIIYGLSYSYILTKDIIVIATAVLPNHGIGIRNGGILTVGYVW